MPYCLVIITSRNLSKRIKLLKIKFSFNHYYQEEAENIDHLQKIHSATSPIVSTSNISLVLSS